MAAEQPVRHYRQLKVWQLGMDLVEGVYGLTEQFPKHQLYGLTSQVQRASVSIPSNIAEGHARGSTNQFLHSISIAAGSLAEMETQLLLGARLRFATEASVDLLLSQASEVGKMLNGLEQSLRRKL